MSNTHIMALTIVIGFYATLGIAHLLQPKEDDDSQQPSTQWRRHLEKPSHLAFRPTRFDRRPGNSRRTQQC